MEQVRVGVIGVGRMGQSHCRVYASLPRAQLVGVCDRDTELGRRVARQYEVPFYPEVDQLLRHVDAVSIVTPTPAHLELALAALAAGVHLLVEKPLTDTIATAEQLVAAAADGPLVLQVGDIERFNPNYMELKNVLAGLTMLVVNFRRLSPYQGSNTDVDVILDLMIHDLDLALDLVGQMPLMINTHGLTAFSGAVDHVEAQLGLTAGPLLTVTASRITEQKVRCIEVTTAEAFIEADLLHKAIAVHRRTIGEYLNLNHRGVKYRQESLIERIHVPAFEPLFLELQHFIDCILTGQPTAVPARDGLRAMRLAQTIQQTLQPRLLDLSLTLAPAAPQQLVMAA